MERLIVEGGHPLAGTVRSQGNKNEALPCLAASLLTPEPVVLRNVPRIRDVLEMIQLLRHLGARVEELSPNDYRIEAREIRAVEPDPEVCRRLRAAILLAGPLLARFPTLTLPPPGGDVIGRRRLDEHVAALSALGARVTVEDRKYRFQRHRLAGADIFLDERSVTATENAVMAAVLAQGMTRLENAACEPHVVGLCRMLNAMGARIRGAGTHILEIEGVGELGGVEHTIGPDLLEIGGYILLGALTGSELVVEEVRPEELRVIRSAFAKVGVRFQVEEVAEGGEHQAARAGSAPASRWRVRVPPQQELAVEPDFSGDIPKIDDGPWPSFPTDLMSPLIVAATQARGTVLFFEKMYDGRMFFVDHLVAMGARIVLCDPHRIVVVGPSPLYGTTVSSPDIRAGMALVLAALSAQGTTTIYNVGQIDRGYENLEQKLKSLGARLERVRT